MPGPFPTRRTWRRLRWLGVALLLAGCAERSRPPVDAGPAATGAAADAGELEPLPVVTFTLLALLPDAGVQPVPSGAGLRPVIEPVAQLELRSDQGLRNYRVRLLDEAERSVVSDDTAEETDAGVAYRLSLAEPLRSGHAYTLVVDAESDAPLTDALGRTVPEQRLEFQVSGEKSKPAPPRRQRGKRRN
jgi:hypothetical protein